MKYLFLNIKRSKSISLVLILIAVCLLPSCNITPNPTTTSTIGTTTTVSTTTTTVAMQLLASDGVSGDRFGNSVAESSNGNIIVVGASAKNMNQGAVYIYQWDGTSWNETKITASDGVPGDKFGECVSITSNGNMIVVGADGRNSNRGTVYIYRWNGTSWDETELTAFNGVNDDHFGYNVSASLEGDVLVVGAWGCNNERGAAYICKWNGTSWDETNLIASVSAAGDQYGYSVSVSDDGNTTVVGAFGRSYSRGEIHIYKWNGSSWYKSTNMTLLNSAMYDSLGMTVVSSGDGETIIAGAYGRYSMSGAVYIYKWNGVSWGMASELMHDGGRVGEWFGSSLFASKDCNTVVIGARWGDSWAGTAHIYKWDGTGWTGSELPKAITGYDDNFAGSVSLSADGGIAVVSDTDYDTYLGTVWVYRQD